MLASTYRAPSDFNGDGRSDLFLRDSDGIGYFLYGTEDGGLEEGPILDFSPAGYVAGIGDVNGDHREDILFATDLALRGTLLLSAVQTASYGFQPDWEAASLLPQGSVIAGTADFNGDGRTDVLLRSDDGTVTSWLTTGSKATILDVPDAPFKPSALHITVPDDWHIITTDDFNGDGFDDILWRSDAGTVREWLGQADGLFHGNVAKLDITVPEDWHIVGTGDFNGDGFADILWRSDEGTVRDWLGQADGAFHGNVANFNITVPLDWHVVATGDYNGDGFSDIMWRSDEGILRDWLGQADGTFIGNVANLDFNPGDDLSIETGISGLWDH